MSRELVNLLVERIYLSVRMDLVDDGRNLAQERRVTLFRLEVEALVNRILRQFPTLLDYRS